MLLPVMLVSWLIALFISLGLFAPPDLTVLSSLLMSALAVCSAIFPILDTYQPYGRLIQFSDAPFDAALAQLGQQVQFPWKENWALKI